MRVGFIGVGSQGAPMARRIAESGHDLTVWARRPESLDQFDGLAVHRAATPSEVGARSAVVGICVVADSDVDEVVTGPDGVLEGMSAGGTLLIHSTIHPDTCRRIASVARAAGVDVLDAPVSGGGRAAAKGQLLVMVGGDSTVLDRCRPILETFGDPIRHVGPLGAGQTAKLVNNALFAATLSMANEALGLGVALGLDEHELMESLQHGSANCAALGLAASMRARLGEPGGGSAGVAGLLTKDLDLVSELAERQGADVRALRDAADLWLGFALPDAE